MSTDDLARKWFGARFDQLDPLLQSLHAKGGRLAGDVRLSYGRGLAGLIGRRLAKKMGLPDAGIHHLSVGISHQPDGLHWDRTFDHVFTVKSLFKPVGNIDGGYWIESTGPLTLKLTVDILDGGWHWRTLGIRYSGIPLPGMLFPETIAYKRVEGGGYRFHVEFIMPIVGSLVSYSGLLVAESMHN